MKNTSKSLQELNEASFNMPNGLMNCNFNAKNVRQAPQCDIYDGLCLRTYRNLALVATNNIKIINHCLQWMGGNVNDAIEQ
ncbi:hypothetical protein [Nostoc sp. 2RC]|uniref:hypothetical protein n=1 Tax=Nostoc sp. 2RC TaxID=2485484 RepID=UPI0016279C70|nr:hypothetical protein [Nostoc sp. 2RC]MBC1241375.1 hypothetical protein [Nostoc sp. 2RC]